MSPFDVTDTRGYDASLHITHCLLHDILWVQINVPVVDSVRLNKLYCNIFQNPQNYELTNVNFDGMSRVSSPGKLNIQPSPRASCPCDIGRRFLISSLQWSDIKELRNSEGEVYKFLMNVGKTCTK